MVHFVWGGTERNIPVPMATPASLLSTRESTVRDTCFGDVVYRGLP